MFKQLNKAYCQKYNTIGMEGSFLSARSSYTFYVTQTAQIMWKSEKETN